MEQELKIKLFCIVILLFLNVAIILNGLSLDCSECLINFQSSTQTGKMQDREPTTLNISVTELYDSYIDDFCIVKFGDHGFYKDELK